MKHVKAETGEKIKRLSAEAVVPDVIALLMEYVITGRNQGKRSVSEVTVFNDGQEREAERASRASQSSAVTFPPPPVKTARMEPTVGTASVKSEREPLLPPGAERTPVKGKNYEMDLDALKCPTCTGPLSVPAYQVRML